MIGCSKVIIASAPMLASLRSAGIRIWLYARKPGQIIFPKQENSSIPLTRPVGRLRARISGAERRVLSGRKPWSICGSPRRSILFRAYFQQIARRGDHKMCLITRNSSGPARARWVAA